MSNIREVLEDLVDEYMPSNDEQDALAKSFFKEDLRQALKELLLSEAIAAAVCPPKGEFTITKAIPIEAIEKLFGSD